jgi:poly-gamma-glutamate capsule biosynthesis protein CapA/YwtB (metallophosphatase superfamily)
MRRFFYVSICIIFVLTVLYLLFFKEQGNLYSLENILNRSLAEDYAVNSAENDHIADTNELPAPEEIIPDIRNVNIVMVGNIFPHMPQIEQAYIGDGQYDFSPSFEFIAPLLQAADLAVGDLETAQAGPDINFLGFSGYTGFPQFNAPQELSVALRDAGIDILTLGNNHALDRGLEGLFVTLDHLHSLGIKTFGAYKTRKERDTPLIVERNGIKIAFIGYTFSTNGISIPDGHDYCLNYAPGFQDIASIISDIETARFHGADIIAVFPHWGENEYATEPQPQFYRQVAADLAAAGADLIIGGHPKYIQPIEWFFNEREDGTERATFVIYSQGTFLSNQHYPRNPSPLVEYGLVLDLNLSKNMETGDAWISAVNYEITWIHRLWRHRILPLSDVFQGSPLTYNLNDSKIEELKSWHQRIVENIEAYGHSEMKERAMEISKDN